MRISLTRRMYSIVNSMAVVRILFLLISSVLCNASEPYCRQFEYDEKMLSKMIRAEIDLETLKKEFLTLETALDQKIELVNKRNNDNMDGNLQALSIDGGWTDWSMWSECTVSCGGGILSRYRSCDNPARYLKGRMCEGPPIEYRSCTTQPCHAADGALVTTKVGFTVRSPSSIKNGVLVFSLVVSNYRDDFVTDTGRFVCGVPGLYLFSATILGKSSTSSPCYCYIYVGSTSYSLAYAHTKHTGDYPSGTASLVYQLNKGDEVYLGGCTTQADMDPNTHFSGALIQ